MDKPKIDVAAALLTCKEESDRCRAKAGNRPIKIQKCLIQELACIANLLDQIGLNGENDEDDSQPKTAE